MRLPARQNTHTQPEDFEETLFVLRRVRPSNHPSAEDMSFTLLTSGKRVGCETPRLLTNARRVRVRYAARHGNVSRSLGLGECLAVSATLERVQAPPTIELDDTYVLDGWRLEDGPSHRVFSEDPAAARFLGWTVEDARAAPDSYYVEGVRGFQKEWAAGTRLSLAIRERATGEAVGSVELRPVGDTAAVSYLVAPKFRGRGLAPRALDALLEWGRRELSLRRATLGCHVENVASQRVAAKCGFTLIAREGDDLRFSRDL
jgi:[ribosomal protein S5]-alanine N-acetyltransferase